jgi:hypothetical protein
MNLTALDHALATAAGAVLAGIGQHHPLPQGSGQDGLAFPDHKGLAAGCDADFKLFHKSLSKNGRPLSPIAGKLASKTKN